MKKFIKVLGILVVLVVIIAIILIAVYKNQIGSVSDDKTVIVLDINKGETYSTLGPVLYEKGLIKSELFYKVYIKLNNPSNLKAGRYELNKSMGLEEILGVINKGSNYNPDVIKITFKEGINFRKIASLIEENTNNSKEDVFDLLKDSEYIDSLIADYWFITEDIKDTKIYYPLEGYLFPDTYQFLNKDVSVKDIFKKMLDKMDLVLIPYKDEINNSKYGIHDIMTLASIIELEASNSDDRASVAGVFYNRLKDKWVLGSDVTTYYASKIDDFSYSLTYKELNNCSNSYNTRCNTYAGLPIGPISVPSKESIEAAINPKEHDYYYFVADCNGKTYLNKNSSGHAATISQLKSDKNWCV